MLKKFVQRIKARAIEKAVQAAIKADRQQAVGIVQLCLIASKPDLIVEFLRQRLTEDQALERLKLIPRCAPALTEEQAKQQTTIH